MNINEMLAAVKAVPMPSLLEAFGVRPVGGQHRAQLVYHAPYRKDSHPSMSVFLHNGEWLYKDHSTAEFGTNIDIIIKMGICRTWRDAMQYIAQHFLFVSADSQTPIHSNLSASSYRPKCQGEVTSVAPIEGSPAERYVTRVRCIPIDIASRYLSFINYKYNGTQPLSGIGWPTVNGGWSVRWPVDLGPGKGKGFVGRGGPSLFLAKAEGRTAECDVFEGIFDFLSYITLKGWPQQNDAIVLNSAENIKAAIPFIKDYAVVNAFLDDDAAGNDAMATLKLNCHQQMNDRSKIFDGYKDLNDYLKSTKK